MRLLPFVGLCVLAFGCGKVDPATVSIKSVKWPELDKAIAAHKGKVVLLDLWAEY